jgi:hypothetical protein
MYNRGLYSLSFLLMAACGGNASEGAATGSASSLTATATVTATGSPTGVLPIAGQWARASEPIESSPSAIFGGSLDGRWAVYGTYANPAQPLQSSYVV